MAAGQELENKKMKRIATVGLMVAALGLSACSGLNTKEQRMLSGGAIGAGTGVAATVITGGCIACGAVVGGAVGTAAGYLYHEGKSH